MKKTENDKKTICMIVPDQMVKGGIAAVTSGYRASKLETAAKIIYVESYRDGNRFQKLIKAIASYFVFLNVIYFKKVDLVHIHSSFGPSFYRKLPFICIAHNHKIPIVNHIHGAEFDKFFETASEKKKKLIKKTYNKCDSIIALSDEWREKLKNIVPEDKITVIPNYAINVEESLDYHKSEIYGKSQNINVLFLGELGKRKGTFDLIEIAKLVKERYTGSKTIKFVLAGAGSDEDEKLLNQMVADYGLDHFVSFPGWIRGEDKKNALMNAYLFILPSYNEGMPMSILDACGYGLPIISTNVGGIPKIVNDGKNGFLYEAGDITGMADAVLKLIEDSDLANSFSEYSYSTIAEKYSLNIHLDKLLSNWDKVLS